MPNIQKCSCNNLKSSTQIRKTGLINFGKEFKEVYILDTKSGETVKLIRLKKIMINK